MGRSLREVRASVKDLVVDQIRHALDHEIPILGGRPRALLATEEGRAKVEAWLRHAEKQGYPERASPSGRYLDLDPLRVELGLPVEPD